MQVVSCVPLRSRILTRTGRKQHGQVAVGDETLGFNPNTGRCEWTRVTWVVHHENAPVRRIGHSRWHADVTGEHRWWSESRYKEFVDGDTTCPDCDRSFATPRAFQVHRSKIHGVKRAPVNRNRYVGEFVRTNDLATRHRLRLAAPADTVGIPNMTLDEVRIVAWIQGDGGAYSAGARGWDVSIYQAKPDMVAKLRALLADVPHTEHIRNRGQRRLDEHHFKLRRAYGTELVTRSGLMNVEPSRFVLELSPAQRSAWLDAMIDAEGNRQNDDRGWREFVRIAQIDGPLQDAITLAVYLEGWRPSRSTLVREGDHPDHRPSALIGMCRPHVAPSMFAEPVDQGIQDVWCVETELGTWTMVQDGQIMLTGNSTYQAIADPRHNVGTYLHGVSIDPLAPTVPGARCLEHEVKGAPSAGNPSESDGSDHSPSRPDRTSHSRPNR